MWSERLEKITSVSEQLCSQVALNILMNLEDAHSTYAQSFHLVKREIAKVRTWHMLFSLTVTWKYAEIIVPSSSSSSLLLLFFFCYFQGFLYSGQPVKVADFWLCLASYSVGLHILEILSLKMAKHRQTPISTMKLELCLYKGIRIIIYSPKPTKPSEW